MILKIQDCMVENNINLYSEHNAMVNIHLDSVEWFMP